MNKRDTYDFGGYATKNDIKCSDGRTIKRDAFIDNDNSKVPLLWQHNHKDPNNVVGHAVLENRQDGVYCYCNLNDTEQGINARTLIEHKDISSLSIYANNLKHRGRDVIHGQIREVSLVLAGANPGALIDYVNISHEDGENGEDAIVYMDQQIQTGGVKMEREQQELSHEETSTKTVQQVFDTLNEDQKTMLYTIIAQILDDEENGDAEHSDYEGEDFMKHNVFDNQEEEMYEVLTHSDTEAIFDDAVKMGSLKQSVLKHGITNLDYLYPDAHELNSTPDFIKRDTGWVSKFLNGVRKSPFSKIKTTHARITEDEARAKGYIKGAQKFEEVFSLLHRTTDAQTIYKKQKLDRDDILDIRSMDVVSFINAEMRVMLDEEIARAMLVGDGRSIESADKIKADKIRPIYSDDDLYSIKTLVEFPTVELTSDTTEANLLIDAIIKSRIGYKGTGTPNMYCTPETLTKLLLVKDTIGRRLYSTVTELASALRVKTIEEVEVMNNITRTDDGKTKKLEAILVNPVDYTAGSNKGGKIGMFDDFDIDYNQYKYLIESRTSGALTKPYGAVVIESYNKA